MVVMFSVKKKKKRKSKNNKALCVALGKLPNRVSVPATGPQFSVFKDVRPFLFGLPLGFRGSRGMWATAV